MSDLTPDTSIAAMAAMLKRLEAKISGAQSKPPARHSHRVEAHSGQPTSAPEKQDTMASADAAAAKPKPTSSCDLPRPLNLSVAEFCRQVGVKKTKGYKLLADHQVVIVRLGLKSLIPATELDRVQAALLRAATPVKPTEKARIMAKASVRSRKAKPPP